MLTTRLWMGSVLTCLVVGMLTFDGYSDYYLFQFVFQVFLALAACRELVGLLGVNRAPIVPLCYLGVIGLTVLNWIYRGVFYFLHASKTIDWPLVDPDSRFWACVFGVATFLLLAIFLWEMSTFQEGNGSFERMARTWLVISYLGLLPCFLAQIRWLYPNAKPMGTTALALAIFVPKGCDIGAYFTGRLIGRHRMTPVLSPKKTWEGAAGGLLFAALVAVAIDRLCPVPVLRENLGNEIGFGLSVGLAGMLGDLAESLIKRDCQQKDASQTVPGFGGVLDVVDAVIFAAPVAYVWFLMLRT